MKQDWPLTRVREPRSSIGVIADRETVAIMATLDEVRRQVGVSYPGE